MARPNKTRPAISGELLAKVPPLPAAGELETMDDLQREWQRLHRGRDRNQIDSEKFRDLSYSMQVGTPITRGRNDLRVAVELIQRLDRHNALEAGTLSSAPMEAMPVPEPDGEDPRP